jgi:CPA2 family monovalent cation:H+ antiporter-2
LHLGFPVHKVQEYEDAVRRDYYDVRIKTEQERQLLRDLLRASDNIGIIWLRVAAAHPLVGQTLAEANVRAQTGASVVAIMRGRELITNPEPRTMVRANDLVGLVGDGTQLHRAQEILAASEDGSR